MITRKLQKLQAAMAEHEGWSFTGSGAGNSTAPTIAFRNNNPGNLRSSPFMLGQSGGFAVFVDDNVGVFAHLFDLWSKCTGKTTTGLGPKNTLADLIAKYAPPTENNTERYIQAVEKYLDIPRTTPLSYFVS
jgi:hypothetical protein